jgi:predicted DNA-binding transcriptional regulator YafY
VIATSARLLRLVSLLSTRPSWTNSELAERMDVTERTVRRDIAKLRDLGYAVHSDPGPWGGYRLGPCARPRSAVFATENPTWGSQTHPR